MGTLIDVSHVNGKESAYRVRWERDDTFWEFLKGMFEVESQRFFLTAVQNHTLELLAKHTEVDEEHFLVFAIVDRGTAEKEKTLEHWRYRYLKAVLLGSHRRTHEGPHLGLSIRFCHYHGDSHIYCQFFANWQATYAHFILFSKLRKKYISRYH